MDDQMEERAKNEMPKPRTIKSIEEVMEAVEVVIDTNFFNAFSEQSLSLSLPFLKRVISNQGLIDLKLFKKSWRLLNCFPKTMKVIREIQENLLCVGKRKDLITKKKKTDSKCWCNKTGLPLNANHIISVAEESQEISTSDMTLS